MGHGRENAVPGLPNSCHLPPPWGDYNPAPCRYRDFRVGWMGTKEGGWLIVNSWFYLSLAGPRNCGQVQYQADLCCGGCGDPTLRTGEVQVKSGR